ncbi:uncharacterized protein DS421_12g378320 [Arachis hypogaea]|nr:uncharacterized protein DS421_12g378320 [Arachis hypogaea]
MSNIAHVACRVKSLNSHHASFMQQHRFTLSGHGSSTASCTQKWTFGGGGVLVYCKVECAAIENELCSSNQGSAFKYRKKKQCELPEEGLGRRNESNMKKRVEWCCVVLEECCMKVKIQLWKTSEDNRSELVTISCDHLGPFSCQISSVPNMPRRSLSYR